MYLVGTVFAILHKISEMPQNSGNILTLAEISERKREKHVVKFIQE